MRKIERSTAFRRDYKHAAKGPHREKLDRLFISVLESLLQDRPLEPRFHDHALTGNWHGCRECHIKPDLLLIYRKTTDNGLHLVRLGSHSDLFG